MLILTLPFILRGRFWARFGKVGIVGLGWIIVDLSRYKLKEEKEYQGSGCDDKSFHFFLNTIPIYSVQQRKLSFKRGYCNCVVKDIKKFHFFVVSFFVNSIGGTSLHACCVVCFFLFCVDRILPISSFVVSLPHPL